MGPVLHGDRHAVGGLEDRGRADGRGCGVERDLCIGAVCPNGRYVNGLAGGHGLGIDGLSEAPVGLYLDRREIVRVGELELFEDARVVLELIAGYLVSPLARPRLEVVLARLGGEAQPRDRCA